jgi:hypothetical protein
MNNNLIVELSQRESTKITQNGDYLVNLADPVIIYPGDSILTKNIYLDTVDNNLDRITLTQNVNLDVSVGYYMLDWDIIDKTYNPQLPVATYPTGRHYVLMKESGTEDMISVEFGSIKKSDQSGFGTIYFDYVDNSGVPQETSIFVPLFFTNPETTAFNGTTGIYCMQNSFVLSPKNTPQYIAKKYNMQFIKFTANTVPSSVRRDPYITSTRFVIPKGSYSPAEFGETVSSIMSSNSGHFHPNAAGNDELFGLQTPFLFISSEIQDASSGPLFWDNTNQTTDIETRQQINYNTTTTSNTKVRKIIGTSQVALEYNQDLDKFTWADIHLPPYDDDGNVSVGYKRLGTMTSLQNWFLYNKNSGIFFTKFDSQYEDGSPINIWEDILGFTQDNLVKISEQRTTTSAPPYTNFDYTDVVSLLQDGVNITGEYPSIDVYVQKKKSGTSQGGAINYNSLNIDETNPEILGTSTDTVKLVANTPYEELDNESGYFLVQLENCFKSSVVGAKSITNTTAAIVSKYYSYKSFTSASSDSGIAYIHNSPLPMVLSSVKVSVLDPNTKKVASTIGADNTVFLEIIRAQPEMK